MALAIIFGISAIVCLYSAIFSVPAAVQSIHPPEAELRIAAATGNLSWMARWGMAIYATVSVALTVLFSWLCFRFAKKWRQF